MDVLIVMEVKLCMHGYHCLNHYTLMLYSFFFNWDIGYSYKGDCRGAAG